MPKPLCLFCCGLVLWLGQAAPAVRAQSLPALLAPLSRLTPAAPSAPLAAPPRAPVVFNGHVLFQVYGSGDRNAQDRADLASLRLADALRALPRNGDIVAPSVVVDEGGQEYVLRLAGEPLLTITQTDAAGSGQTTDQLADTWAGAIRRAFAEALRERRPPYLRWAARQVALLLAAGVLCQLLLWAVARRINSSPGWPVQVLLWYAVVRIALELFPQTRPINVVLRESALRPVTFFVDAALTAAALARLWGAVLRRLFPPVPEHLSVEERTERTVRRRATLGGVARVTGVTVIWVVALLAWLTGSGVNLSALLASAGLIGVALGLAAQDSMKDLVAGINILADDRFGVGDNIVVGAFDGRVERLTLRITQIRDMSGRLITLPNRSIVEVANQTARWAQVDLKVGVSYLDDLQGAMDVLQETAQALASERPELVLADPEMLGVDSFNDLNVTLRLTLRTPPGDQWMAARELRGRVKAAFDAAGIAIITPQYVPPPPPRDDKAAANGRPPGDTGQADPPPPATADERGGTTHY